MSLLILPSLMLRALGEALFVIVALLFISPRHAKAGLLLGAAGSLNLLLTLGQPIAECMGFGALANSSSDAWLMVVLYAFALLVPVAQTFNLMLILLAIVLLIREVPSRRGPPPESSDPSA